MRKDAAEAFNNKLLTTNEAAAFLGISRRTIQDLAASRALAFVKFGRNVRFDIDDLRSFVDSKRVRPTGWKGA